LTKKSLMKKNINFPLDLFYRHLRWTLILKSKKLFYSLFSGKYFAISIYNTRKETNVLLSINQFMKSKSFGDERFNNS
jgi:hypothetical protein